MSPLADEILTMVHAFGDVGRRDEVRRLAFRVDQAIAAEREACAKVAKFEADAADSACCAAVGDKIEAAIRARGGA